MAELSAQSPPLKRSDTAQFEDYFAHNLPPPQLDAYTDRVQAFVARHTAVLDANATAARQRPIVLVTSGGTTVPLENQTVRFIDNFSAGTRGATSAEYFIANGYAVIFLHRQYSLLPYSRHYSHSTNCFLDYMQTDASNGQVVVADEYQADMLRVLQEYSRAKQEQTLLLLSFTTINEYLWLLRRIAQLMQPAGEQALFYLAAAVSDFFVPAERMVEHKIQSAEEFSAARSTDGTSAPPAATMRDKSLIIDLDPVPKFLKRLVDGWAPSAMIVSFKLETDPSILIAKAQHALHKYSHHLVIGNLLSTRKHEVVFVSQANGEKWIRVPARPTKLGGAEALTEWAKEGDDGSETIVEIESLIIPEVKRLHEAFIATRAHR